MAKTETRELSSPPGSLELYAKAAAPMVPGASRLPFVGGGGGQIPKLELHLPDVEIDPGHLARYSRVCGFRLADTLPATYPHILAFPLHMALMTDSSFPFGPVGLVHISNRIVQHRRIPVGERLDLRVHATQLEPHPKGRQFTLVSEARISGELVWEDFSTNLRFGGGSGEDSDKKKSRKQPPPEASTWKLDGGLGRRYASVSGDRNPIHMHDLSAKLFGFPKAIAHGMWTKARSLAALEGRLPSEYEVEVDFKKPILLPAKVTFGSAEERGATRFSVRDPRKGAPHLDGTVRPSKKKSPGQRKSK
jgi:acyl dehydratase